MRKRLPPAVEACRVLSGRNASDPSWGACGLFIFRRERGPKLELRAIASDGRDEHGVPYPEVGGWEHVSVSTAARCPTWEEMCAMKDAFWDEEECVMQLHPPRSAWINNHPYCLHLWKPPAAIQMPPPILVGVKSLGLLTPA